METHKKLPRLYPDNHQAQTVSTKNLKALFDAPKSLRNVRYLMWIQLSAGASPVSQIASAAKVQTKTGTIKTCRPKSKSCPRTFPYIYLIHNLFGYVHNICPYNYVLSRHKDPRTIYVQALERGSNTIQCSGSETYNPDGIEWQLFSQALSHFKWSPSVPRGCFLTWG